MASTSRYTVPFRRKRAGKTDYRARLELLKSRKPRLVIRKTLASMIGQVVQYAENGDKVLVSVNSRHLKKHGLTVVNGNVPVAYLTGLLLAKQAKAHKIHDAVVDLGLQQLTQKSRIYAFIKGVKEGGLHITVDSAVLPDENRVMGKHIEQYAAKIKDDDAAYKKQFGFYLKHHVDPTTISQLYGKVKKALSE